MRLLSRPRLAMRRGILIYPLKLSTRDYLAFAACTEGQKPYAHLRHTCSLRFGSRQRKPPSVFTSAVVNWYSLESYLRRYFLLSANTLTVSAAIALSNSLSTSFRSKSGSKRRYALTCVSDITNSSFIVFFTILVFLNRHPRDRATKPPLFARAFLT